MAKLIAVLAPETELVANNVASMFARTKETDSVRIESVHLVLPTTDFMLALQAVHLVEEAAAEYVSAGQFSQKETPVETALYFPA